MNEQEPFFMVICLGLIFFFVGFFLLKSMMPRMNDKRKTKGELVDYEESYDRKYGIMWAGVYEFEVDGKTYRTNSHVRSSSRGFIKKVVKIEYEDSDPTLNIIPSERFIPVICIIIGVGLLIFGGNMYLESKNSVDNINTDTYEAKESIDIVAPEYIE